MMRLVAGATALLLATIAPVGAFAQGVAPQVTVSQVRLSAIDPRDPPYNAKCDGTADDHVALAAAGATAASTGAKLMIPNATCYSTVALSFGKVAVAGASPIIPTNPPAGPTIMCLASIAAPCLTVGTPGSGTDLGASVDNIAVAYFGTPVAGDGGLAIQGHNTTLNKTLVYNTYDGYTFQNGISAHAVQIYTWNVYHNHVVSNGFPEIYITSARFGMNGAGDQSSSNAFLGMTGANPNTIYCNQCQFNLGGVSPKYVLDFYSISSQSDGIYKITDSTYDSGGLGTAIVHSDGTGTCFRCDFGSFTINAPTSVFWSMGSAGPPVQSVFHDSNFFVSSFTMPTGQYDAFALSNLYVSGTVTITGTAGSIASVSNVESGGAMTVSGAWGQLNLSGLSQKTSYTDTATGKVFASGVPATIWTPTLTFGGGSTGMGLTSAGWASRQPDGTVKERFSLYVTAVGSSTGSAAVPNGPYTCQPFAYGSQSQSSTYSSSMTGLTGALTAATNPNSTTISLNQGGAGGNAAVTNSNFTGASYVSGEVSCVPQ